MTNVQSYVLLELRWLLQQLTQKGPGDRFLYRPVLAQGPWMEVLPHSTSVNPPTLAVRDEPQDPVISCSVPVAGHVLVRACEEVAGMNEAYKWMVGVIVRSDVFAVRFSMNS